ncbi:hypothetical protein C0991_005749 [Blastosporella zonata]|nr:hypothetical protein C0991_005749 [Blastosporella zonata]
MHCPTGHEPDLKTLVDVLNEAVRLFAPNASITNVFPFLDRIPGPMPWRTRAQAFRERDAAIYKKLTDEAVKGKGSGMSTFV